MDLSNHQNQYKFNSTGDEWENGVLLCEVAACLLRQNRSVVKTMEQYDESGVVRDGAKPRFLLSSAEVTVKSQATLLRNFTTAVCTIQKEIPMLLNDRIIGDVVGKDLVDGGTPAQWGFLFRLFNLLARVETCDAVNSSQTDSLLFSSRGRKKRRVLQVRSLSPPRLLADRTKKQKKVAEMGKCLSLDLNRADIGSGTSIKHLGLHWSRLTGRSHSLPSRLKVANPKEFTTSSIPGSNSGSIETLGLHERESINCATARESMNPSINKSLDNFHDFHARHYRSNTVQGANFYFKPTPLHKHNPITISLIGNNILNVTKREALAHRQKARIFGRKARQEVLQSPQQEAPIDNSRPHYHDAEIITTRHRKSMGNLTFNVDGKHKVSKRSARTLSPTAFHSKLHSGVQIGLSWNPPTGDPLLLEACRNIVVERITSGQVITVKRWLQSLGLTIHDGEGGVVSLTGSSRSNSANASSRSDTGGMLHVSEPNLLHNQAPGTFTYSIANHQHSMTLLLQSLAQLSVC